VSTYATRTVAASRPFMIVPYEPDSNGSFRPQIPNCCIDHDGDGVPCWITRDHWRQRTTGPGYALFVARCSVHERSFTLYPPGHFPWGRKALAPVAPDGSAVAGADLCDTVFEAAIDAADSVSWERSIPTWSDQEPDPDLDVAGWWSTQHRQLAFCTRLVGADPGLSDDDRHRISEALHVETLVAIEGAAAIREAPGYRARGRAVRDVLARLVLGVLRKLLVAGYHAGLWGRPLWWDGVLRPLVFRTSGTDPP